jgi:peptide/nickel transport system substrate-binding protein
VRRTLLALVVALALIPAAFAQRVTTAIGANPPTLDPQRTFNGFSFHVTNQLYETLVRLTPTGEIVPGIASDWAYQDDVTLRFTIRDGIRFHDGTPLDAAAVAASIARIIDPATAAPGRFVLSSITEARVIDDRTVDVVTSVPFGPLLAHLAHPVAAIVPTTHADSLAREPIGSGPFTFVRWIDGSEVVLAANPDYWGGVPAIAEVIIRIIPEVSTQIIELRSGGVDMIFNVPPDQYLTLAADSALIAEARDGWSGVHLVMNRDYAPLADLRVRQAIAHATDKALLATELLRGLARPGVAPIPPTVRFAADLPEPYPYDPAAARELLAAAGATGLRLRLDVFNNPDLEAVAQVLQFELGQVGIELEIRVQDFSAWTQAVQSDDAQLILSSWGTPTLDADYALYAFFHSSEIPANNRARLRDADVDALLERGRATADAAERRAAYDAVQAAVVADLPMITLYHPKFTFVHRPTLTGAVIAYSWILLDLREATQQN